MRWINPFWAKWNQRDRILLGAVLGGYSILFYRFRSQQGDFGDFIRAGELIWNQENPYSQLMYVNSPVSAVLLFLLSKVLPILLIPTFIQVLNLLGLLYFFKAVLKDSKHETLLWIFFLLLLFNSTRALIANVQVTGLLFGLIAISLTLSRNSASSYKVVFPLWLAMELKPQLAIPFVLIFLLDGKLHRARAAYLAAYYLLAHLLVNIKFGSAIDLLWIEKIVSYSSNSMKEGYEVSYWKGLAILSGQESIVKLLSQGVVLLTLCCVIYLALKARTNWAFLVAILFPVQNSYLHLYDLVPASILIAVLYIGKNTISLIFGLLIFIQIYPLNLLTQIGVLLCCAILIFVNRIEGRRVFVPFFLMSLYSALVILFLKDFSEEMQIILSLTVPLILVLFINRKKLIRIIEI
jgi:hypothetical protein